MTTVSISLPRSLEARRPPRKPKAILTQITAPAGYGADFVCKTEIRENPFRTDNRMRQWPVNPAAMMTGSVRVGQRDKGASGGQGRRPCTRLPLFALFGRLSASGPLQTVPQSCCSNGMLARTFTPSERQFLLKVVERLPKDAGERLLADMSVAEVTQSGDFLKVDLRGYERPAYVGHRNLPVEGKLQDFLGGPVSILVNIDQNERLLEVETIWWSSESGTGVDWSTLEVILPPPEAT